MMDKGVISDVKKKLVDINKTVSALDPAIRSAAFEILAPYYFDDYEPSEGGADGEKAEKKSKSKNSRGTVTLEKFMHEYEHSKPKDNVLLIAAWIYSQHGAIPISAKLCQKISNETGITIPSRPDNTMRTAARKSKSLFTKQAKGWKPTTSGELHLKKTYKVSKGNKPLEDKSDE